MTQNPNLSDLSHRHAATARAILAHPVSHNIHWRDVLALLRVVGEVTQKHDGKYLVKIGAESEVFERPRFKDIDTEQVVDLRRMLTNAGYGATTESADAVALDVALAQRRAVVALDFRSARIFSVAQPSGSKPDTITAPDPYHLDHHLYHRRDAEHTTFDIDKIDTDAFFDEVAEALRPAQEVLLLGHGKGKSNARHAFEAYLTKHHPDIENKIVASVRCDIDDLSNADVLHLGELNFATNLPERDYPDARWGEPRPGEEA
ncbi:MAG: hypothetical protein K0U64_04665 [Actinomycetia bacterium]|nr:hypothetical protein [Actinomycetes bacterium]